MENGYIKLCMLSDLKEKQGKRFIVDEVEVALFLIDGEVFAVSNICSHQHTALIYDGFIEGGCVVCPAHGWMFDLRTGKRQTGSRGIESYPVKIKNEEVFILVKKKDLNW